MEDISQFVVQETLVGKEYTTGCYVDRYTGELSTITFLRDLSPDGASIFGKIIVDSEITQYMHQVTNGLKLQGFEYGHFNVQFIMTTDGPKLFEINGRLSSTESPKAHFGFNSCAAYVYNKYFEKPYLKFAQTDHGKFLRYYDEVYF
jgi:phosphoribosylamine-glycine ligase